VSSDFTVERSGAIYKLNPQLRIYCTWHAGNLTRWHALRDGAINRYSIGIEICQPARQEPVNPYPFEQVRAVAWLCAWLSQEFKIDRAAITTHRDLSYTGRRSDPRRFPFEGPSGFNAQYHGFRGFALEVAMGEEEHEDGDTLTA
jgi:N-acetyl-anhydromuramyl-L-alanine amidase AmpD